MGASATIDYNKESIKDKVYTFVLLIKVFLIISCNCPNNHNNIAMKKKCYSNTKTKEQTVFTPKIPFLDVF